MTTRIRSLIVGAALLTAGLAHGAGDVERGRSIAMQGDGQGGAPCLACHGLDGAGNAGAAFPRLAGLDAGYLRKQLLDYRDGRRSNAVMAPNVARMSDQQIEDVSAYYASLEVPPPAATGATAEQLALGETLVERGDWDNYVVPCKTCHGPGSQGVGETFPALAGQHASYLSQQLQAWKAGTRRNDSNDLMLAIAARLSDEQIAAVSAYLAQQPMGGER
jgi:cytochrome c553